MEALTTFKFERKQFRILDDDGESWFIAKDVARILGYRDAANLTRRLADDEKGTRSVSTPGGHQRLSVITEPGLWTAILGSQVDDALKFKRWLTHEVLPAINHKGAYVSPTITVAQVEELQAELERLKPLALYAQMLEVSPDSCTVKEMAALLTQAGFKVGQNKLFEMLRNDGFLMKEGRRDKNVPTQKAIDMKLFCLEQKSRVTPDAHIMTWRQTLITGKGQLYFLNRYAPQQMLLA